MIVKATQATNFNDLIRDLTSQFSDYSVYTFGSHSQKSIIVRKSDFVGVQITVRKSYIMVDACYPNVFISGLMSLLTASTISPFNAWFNFEKKITGFLKRNYNQ